MVKWSISNAIPVLTRALLRCISTAQVCFPGYLQQQTRISTKCPPYSSSTFGANCPTASPRIVPHPVGPPIRSGMHGARSAGLARAFSVPLLFSATIYIHVCTRHADAHMRATMSEVCFCLLMPAFSGLYIGLMGVCNNGNPKRGCLSVYLSALFGISRASAGAGAAG